MYHLELHQVSAPGLVSLVQKLGNNLIGCEIGVCRAHNLIYLLDRVPEVKLTYAVDPYTPFVDEPWGLISQDEVNGWKSTALGILASQGDRVKFLEMTSTDAANQIEDNHLDYIFIDGDHNCDPVLHDCKLYWNKVKSGGLFSGHDWNLQTVKDAVSKFRDEYNIHTEIKFTDNNVWYWYKE
jgi:hypothetical protein